MTHIICRASFCLFWEEGVCSSEEMEYEPETGCMTFQDVGDLSIEEEDDDFDWEDDKDDDLFDGEDDSEWDDDEEDWDEDDL